MTREPEPIAVRQDCLCCGADAGPCRCSLWCGHPDCGADAALYDDTDDGPMPWVRAVEDVPTRGLL